MTVLNCTVVLLLAAPIFGDATLPGDGLVVHEWGTFTSVAGPNGNTERWQALDGPGDLPCFVHRLPGPNLKFDPGSVRMETPVLYFYSAQKVRASVHVKFQAGSFTEWYPQASVQSGPTGRIDWDAVDILPGPPAQWPTSQGPSRYFAARETDATPIQVGQEQEKLIFYRGIGDFALPLAARVTGGTKLELRNQGKDAIAAAIVFDHHNRKSTYQVIRELRDSASVDLTSLAADTNGVQEDLQTLLVQQGLYPKEAAAMIDTWKDSWFEEGTRVVWLVPRSTVDGVLPLSINPAPTALARVFVGRTEVLSPATRAELSAALAGADLPVLAQYGRFIEPFLRQLSPQGIRAPMSGKARDFLNTQQMDLQQAYGKHACIQ
jgi:hypothetical protein